MIHDKIITKCIVELNVYNASFSDAVYMQRSSITRIIATNLQND